MYIEKVLDLWAQLVKNGSKNKSVAFIPRERFNTCVYCVYLLCIYKHTHIQHIFWKYLQVFTFIYLYKYIHACVCVYIYVINIQNIQSTHIYYVNKILDTSTVKRLIAINRIQNKSFCLHNICVYFVYLLRIYKRTHMHEYICIINIHSTHTYRTVYEAFGLVHITIQMVHWTNPIMFVK